MVASCSPGIRHVWLKVKMIPEVAVSSRVTKWNLLTIIAAIIGLIDTCTNYNKSAPPSHKALFFTALLADYVALVLSSRLFFEQLAAKTLSSSTSLLLTVWLAIVFWKAWTTEFTREPDVMRQLYGVAILCCILIHLAEKVWLRIPYAKFSQLRPLDKLHAGVVFVGYWLWVCRVYPNWDTHIRHFTALWISTAVLTVVSVYVKRSSWHAGDSDAKPVPLLPISSVCHDLVHAIANTTVSMFWTMEAIAQAKGGAAGDYLMCVVSVIVSLVHIGMSLQIRWQNDDRENYACRLTINYRVPKEVLRPFGNILIHHTGYITTLNRYKIYMLIRWLGNFLLFVFGVSQLNLGFLCCEQSAFPAASASCIMGNIASAGMNLLSKFCIAVSATRKLNCVAVGVICVAVFFGVLEKKILELRDAFPAQPVQGILKKKDSPSAAAMKWSDVKKFCKPLRKHSSLFAPQITSSFKELLEVPSTKALHVVIFCNPWSDEEFSCTVCKNQRNRPCWTFFKI